MDTTDETIKPAVRAQYILDNYSELLNKAALNKLSEWPEWLNKDPWYGNRTIEQVIKKIKREQT